MIPPELSKSIQVGFQGTLYVANDYAQMLEKYETGASQAAKKEILAGWLEHQKEIYDYVKTDKTEGETNGVE